jgi:hypothetical protein
MTDFRVELRHRCRNPRCRSKLPTPVSNEREAFCTRGCHSSFYLHRCLICERRIEQPKRGRRQICRRASCRNALQGRYSLGRYHASSNAKLISESADSIGVKDAIKPRPWRHVAGPPLTPSQFHCATVGGEEAVAAATRTNLRYWREANARAEQRCLIKRNDAPIELRGE